MYYHKYAWMMCISKVSWYLFTIYKAWAVIWSNTCPNPAGVSYPSTPYIPLPLPWGYPCSSLMLVSPVITPWFYEMWHVAFHVLCLFLWAGIKSLGKIGLHVSSHLIFMFLGSTSCWLLHKLSPQFMRCDSQPFTFAACCHGQTTSLARFGGFYVNSQLNYILLGSTCQLVQESSLESKKHNFSCLIFKSVQTRYVFMLEQ